MFDLALSWIPDSQYYTILALLSIVLLLNVYILAVNH